MIPHQVEQNTPAWDELRAGKFTASEAKKLLTPTGKMSTQRFETFGRLIAERMMWQEPEPIPATYWMDRGTELEQEARDWFALEKNRPVTTSTGFIESDDGLFGCSPDGVVSHNTPLELKVPKPSTHIRWLLDGELPKEHIQQVHMQMVVMDSPGAYFMSYHPEMDPLLVSVEWDEYTDLMAAAMSLFAEEYKTAWKQITGIDYERL